MRIAILAKNFYAASGMVDLLNSIIRSLVAVANGNDIELYFILPKEGPIAVANYFQASARQALKRTLGIDAAKNIVQRVPRRDCFKKLFDEYYDIVTPVYVDSGRMALRATLRKIEAHVAMPSPTPLGTHFQTPWIGYVYDFQHKYLVDLFDDKTKRIRDCAFERMLTQARAVIVNAATVAADARRFFPAAQAQVFSLPFNAAPSDGWLEDRPDLLVGYDLYQSYFMISNQFWIHKDHRTAFHAFEKLTAEYPDVGLICTGSTSPDFRDPGHVDRLRFELRRAGIDTRVRILGLIPKRDQIEIMKHAIAVVQPTLFEGGPGGGAVYDAVALGVPAIVSDIPVNQELKEERVHFFRAGDAEQLAGRMREMLENPQQPRPAMNILLERGLHRRRACGEVLLRAIEYARHRSL